MPGVAHIALVDAAGCGWRIAFLFSNAEVRLTTGDAYSCFILARPFPTFPTSIKYDG